VKKNRIVFRADGNVIAGYGHVIRSLSLAATLKKRYRCVFIIQHTDDFLKAQIKEVCDELIEIPVTKDLLKESERLSTKVIRSDDIVVLDGYNFNTDYQRQIKRSCFKLVSIDDIYKTHFLSDAVINHGEGIDESKYSVERYTRLYLGSAYAILRRPFLKAFHPEKTLTEQNKNKRYTVFINFGGTDQQNYTERALKMCLKNSQIKNIDIVTGNYYPYRDKLNKLKKDHPELSIGIYSGLSAQAISKLMKRSAFGICSASTVSYEYASCGGILFVFKTVDNQKYIYQFLIRSKAAFPAGTFLKTISKVKTLDFRKKYFRNRKKYFSGDSDKSLLNIFNKFEEERTLSFRKARTSDVMTYFKWVNEPEVRKNSIHTEPVLIGQHKEWFQNRLKDKESSLFIFEKNKRPLGQVRFDRVLNKAELDYSIDKIYRGKGYGQVILNKAINAYSNENRGVEILAKVKIDNIPSNKVFISLGFAKYKQAIIGKVVYNHYRLKI
jgi:UDP-2,4-diacetamido-2,4,6-trideoxy-beta-L-altropyranose hydrolase